MLLLPFSILCVYGAGSAVEATPPYAGLGLSMLGIAVLATCHAGLRWKYAGWRMSTYVARLLVMSIMSIFIFLIACVFSDMRVTSGGQNISLFALSSVFMTGNLFCVLWILFVDDEKLRSAFGQFHNYLEKRRKKGLLGKR